MNTHASVRIFSLLLLGPWQLFAAEPALMPTCFPSSSIYNSQSNILEIQEVISDNNQEVIYQAQLKQQQSETPFLFQLSGLTQNLNTTSNVRTNYTTQDQTLTIPSLCIRSNNIVTKDYQVQLQAIPNSDPQRFRVSEAV
jgi:hypothetical protein